MKSKKVCFITILLLIVIIGLVYFWGSIKLNSYKRNQQLYISNKVAQLNVQYNNSLKLRTDSLIKTLAIPLSYFVKNAMEFNNNSGINNCFNEIVKEKGFKDISLIKKGKIIISTNKKYEGDPVEKLYPAEFANYKEITIKNMQSNLSNIIIPIMSTNTQIAFVVITFEN